MLVLSINYYRRLIVKPAAARRNPLLRVRAVSGFFSWYGYAAALFAGMPAAFFLNFLGVGGIPLPGIVKYVLIAYGMLYNRQKPGIM
jgi:hypothetical protein